ncbi:DNA cytosine methyltransferase [Mycoplasmopsis verecunda]|uniref:DNA (cytosine-5-)-methyltransferase n=1 Tax=Mycoplasmopsis verecunda TaxID=171291 RepID=A0A1T4KXG7_9BACT|nr:DNA cytosine methyltransferase [Mycoplasmopsis verecunda]WPB54329.1 DNA cytosine methyltransferase [Mycoplasmopsis verecunda]SJZ47134.1 DNA (cytosine-5)-methyltransferase 1 [Mycoplasmopsis verecunda]
MNKKIGVTSLFSSAGIGTFYLDKLDLNLSLSNELLLKRAQYHSFLYPNCLSIAGDITDEKIFNTLINKHKELGNEILIATPPCQGMSVAGKNDPNDVRNLLIVQVVEFIKLTKPKLIMIENVVQLYKTKIFVNNELILIKDYIIKELSSLYKHIDFYTVNSKEFDTPQDRKRALVIISNEKFKMSQPTPITSVRDAIEHLPSLEPGQCSSIPYHNAKTHSDRQISWMRNTPTGKSALHNETNYPVKTDGQRIKGFATTYKRIEWDKPSPTITMANGSISSQNNVHPGRLNPDGTYSDARVLTLKEIFLLTGLDDTFQVPEWASENLVRQIIGESVPPKIFYLFLKENKDVLKKFNK